MVSDKVVSFKSTPMWEGRLAKSVGLSSAKDSSSSGVQISWGTEKFFSVFAVCVAIEVEEVLDVCALFESKEDAASDKFSF